MVDRGPVKHYDLSEDKLFSVSMGIVCRVVCVPANWDSYRIEAAANAEGLPAGPDSNLRWAISHLHERGDDFDMRTNRPCNESITRVHWLLSC